MTSRSRLRAWLELVRLPNLFTVPGDQLVGYFLAGGGIEGAGGVLHVVPMLLSGMLLYAAGLIFNDIADYGEDSRDRPGRPLPSGQISRTAAWVTGVASAIAGVVLAAWCSKTAAVVAVALLVLVLLYDFVSRRIRLLGVMNMGLCRGFSVLLGAACLGRSALDTPSMLAAAGGLALYILAVSLLALDETRKEAPRTARWLPPGGLVVWFGVVFLVMGSVKIAAAAVALAVVILAVRRSTSNDSVPAVVGYLVRLLLPAQAALCAGAGWVGVAAAAVLLALWPVSAWCGRRFYAS